MPWGSGLKFLSRKQVPILNLLLRSFPEDKCKAGAPRASWEVCLVAREGSLKQTSPERGGSSGVFGGLPSAGQYGSDRWGAGLGLGQSEPTRQPGTSNINRLVGSPGQALGRQLWEEKAQWYENCSVFMVLSQRPGPHFKIVWFPETFWHTRKRPEAEKIVTSHTPNCGFRIDLGTYGRNVCD